MRYALTIVAVSMLAAVAGSSPPAVSPETSRVAQKKIERITNQGMGPGETITLTETELNSYLQYDYADQIPDGVRNLQVRLLKDIGVARANVDFSKLPQTSASPGGMIWTALFRGERELNAVCRYRSANGEAIVEVESAEVDGTPIPGPILDWLVANAVASEVPGFELGKPMPLPINLREIRLEPGQAIVVSY